MHWLIIAIGSCFLKLRHFGFNFSNSLSPVFPCREYTSSKAKLISSTKFQMKAPAMVMNDSTCYVFEILLCLMCYCGNSVQKLMSMSSTRIIATQGKARGGRRRRKIILFRLLVNIVRLPELTSTNHLLRLGKVVESIRFWFERYSWCYLLFFVRCFVFLVVFRLAFVG